MCWHDVEGAWELLVDSKWHAMFMTTSQDLPAGHFCRRVSAKRSHAARTANTRGTSWVGTCSPEKHDCRCSVSDMTDLK